MKALLPLLEQVIINSVLNKKAPFMRKSKLGIALMVMSGLFLCAALVFAIISGYGWLLTQYPQPIAALIVAGIILAVSVIAGASGYLVLKKKPKPVEQDKDILELVFDLAEEYSDEIIEPVQENPKTALILASVAGFIAGETMQ
jgi:hypothetical protein